MRVKQRWNAAAAEYNGADVDDGDDDADGDDDDDHYDNNDYENDDHGDDNDECRRRGNFVCASFVLVVVMTAVLLMVMVNRWRWW